MINEFGEPLAEVEARKAAVNRNRLAIADASLAHQLEIANATLLWQKAALELVLEALRGKANPHPQKMIHCAKYAQRSAEIYLKEFSVEQEKYATLDLAMTHAVKVAKAKCSLCGGTERYNNEPCILCELTAREIAG